MGVLRSLIRRAPCWPTCYRMAMHSLPSMAAVGHILEPWDQRKSAQTGFRPCEAITVDARWTQLARLRIRRRPPSIGIHAISTAGFDHSLRSQPASQHTAQYAAPHRLGGVADALPSPR
jgi:hypothetical protein